MRSDQPADFERQREQIDQQLKQIQQQIPRQNFGKLSEQMARVLIQAQQFNQGIAQLVAPVVQQIAEASNSPFRQFSQLAQAAFYRLQQLEEIEASDYPYKWLGALPLPTYISLFELYKEGREDEIARFLVEALRDEKTLSKFTDTFKQNQFFEPSQPIIDDAIDAHRNGLHSLSIPALMPQIEGILRRIADHQGLHNSSIEKTLNNFQKHGRLNFGFFTTHLANDFFSDEKRNPVLHGNDPTYPSEELSAECLWVLYEIADQSHHL